MTEPLTLAQRLREDETPERIWAGDFDNKGFGHCVAGMQGGLYDEYVRADLVADKADAWDELAKKNATIASLRDAYKAMTDERDDLQSDLERIDRFAQTYKRHMDAAEAKLAKVEAELAQADASDRSARDLLNDVEADRDLLSAELAEARQNYVDANEARLDAVRVLEKVADARMPGEARKLAVEHLSEARSFLASKEASHAE